MYRVANIDFGGEAGIRPGLIIKKSKDSVEVLKITTQAKMNASRYKYRLSGFSGVKGYILTDAVYEVPVHNVKYYTSSLFKCEEDGAMRMVQNFQRVGKLKHIKV